LVEKGTKGSTNEDEKQRKVEKLSIAMQTSAPKLELIEAAVATTMSVES
jgi:hypothetical protein